MQNRVWMEESDSLEITCTDSTDVPRDSSNLIFWAASHLYEICGKKLPGLKIVQENNIPMARGLGSSSACIVAGILGANRFLAFFTVTLPMLRSSVGSAILFAFLTSFDEIAVTLFITGPSVTTIPKKMWDGIRLQIEPTIAALSAILVTVLIVGFLLITLGQIIQSVKNKNK